MDEIVRNNYNQSDYDLVAEPLQDGADFLDSQIAICTCCACTCTCSDDKE